MTRRSIGACVLAWALVNGQPVPSPAPLPPKVAALASQADAARKAGRTDDAVRLYKQVLAQAPRWAEGWWDLGAIHYEASRYQPCRDSFRRLVALDPKGSPGWAMLGLCEFQLKDLDASRTHLARARVLGLPKDQQITAQAFYHEAVLQNKFANFEMALRLCAALSRKEPDSPRLIAVAGIAALRMPVFPHEVPEKDRDLAYRLGRCFVVGGDKPAEEAQRRFEETLKLYPNAPNVHYSYSMFLLANEPEKGMAELKRELEISPDHLPAMISLISEYLKRGETEKALPLAENAVRVGPENFTSHASLGRVLIELDQIPQAIRELELAAKLEPDSPQVYLSLATAYGRAGRKASADRARAQFSRLKKAGIEASSP